MKIMSILHGSSFGGTEQHILNLLPGLSKGGVDCCVLTDQQDLIRKLCTKGIENRHISFNNPYKAILELRKYIDNRCDIVHAHRVDSLAFVVFALTNIDIPIICTIHSIYKDEILQVTDPKSGKVISFSSNYLLNRVNTIVAISNAVKQSLINAGINEHKIKVIFNGVEKSSCVKTSSNYNYTIGFVGRLHYEKGPDILIDAFKILNDKYPNLMRLHIIGDGPMKSQLIGFVKANGLESLCKFEGYVSNPIEKYCNLDVLVLPSREEGMGLVLLEAFSTKVPVIASETGGIKELINNNTGILFECENSKALAESIELLYKFPEISKKLIQSAYELWKNNYTVNHFVQKHIDLLNCI
ncbi:glycosyltransferase [Anaerocolumna aminovalerica]|uniref:Glycosyltransferase involved in cell wall bisynthesis n=1 Tax=Anaerocolumna aminovalerica TaxID=1527 RepID=A0A1I5CTV8_9FIRM|nr:glycosyltransferase family 4 protein [Anaerocolumna aminovalerica]SFN90388.1 Glycosyltransferase involved in cell wall bisynthesis [Anaerocolumna aminovalerica]